VGKMRWEFTDIQSSAYKVERDRSIVSRRVRFFSCDRNTPLMFEAIQDLFLTETSGRNIKGVYFTVPLCSAAQGAVRLI
jgi:hypothetical protein